MTDPCHTGPAARVCSACADRDAGDITQPADGRELRETMVAMLECIAAAGGVPGSGVSLEVLEWARAAARDLRTALALDDGEPSPPCDSVLYALGREAMCVEPGRHPLPHRDATGATWEPSGRAFLRPLQSDATTERADPMSLTAADRRVLDAVAAGAAASPDAVQRAAYAALAELDRLTAIAAAAEVREQRDRWTLRETGSR